MGNKWSQRLSIGVIMITDVILINLAIAVAFWVRFGFQPEARNIEPYISLIPWLSLIAIILFYMFDLYTDWRSKTYPNVIYSIVLSVGLLTLITMALSFLDRGFAFPRTVIFIAAMFQVILLVASRIIVMLLSKHFYGHRKVLIVGHDVDDGLKIGEKLLNHSKGWYIVKEFVNSTDLIQLEAKLKHVDVVLLSSNLNEQDKADIMGLCVKYYKEVLVVPDLFELFLLEAQPQQIDDMLVLSVTPPQLSPAQALLKRSFDVVVSLFLLMICAPVMLLLLILIPLTSPGHALFKQVRIGRDGKPYTIYKFRSMVDHAEKYTGPVLSTENDSRVTPLGRILRATRLDELPQLFNVLKGDMSLVGPRPERPFFTEQFQEQIPYYMYRHAVKPGITGLAQVMGRYSTTAEDKLRYDLLYVRNYSFALDIRILLQTLRVLMQKDAAEGICDTQEEKERLIRLLGLQDVLKKQPSKITKEG